MTTIGVKTITALEELAQRHGGRLVPHLVVKEAAKPGSPLHHLFEWDDTAAARLYRLDQARGLIQEVRIVVEISPERTLDMRGFIHVPAEGDDEGYYALTREALSDSRRAIVLEQARRELDALARKYQDLIDFAALLDEQAMKSKRRRKVA